MRPGDELRDVVCNELTPSFVESMTNFAAWEYRQLYDRLAEEPLISPDQRYYEFARGRSTAISKALIRAAQKHDIPYDIKRLACNGQGKLLVKAGRVIVMQEPMDALYGGRPRAADYKQEISRHAGIITQLELDLGDRPPQLLNWSDGLLAVLLHGACGSRFGERECELGALMLAIPDADYENWIVRLDLHDLAMFGGARTDIGASKYGHSIQEDRVIVRRKNGKGVLRSNG
ncbi:hypothetical protein FHX10_006542 [Rhizobium sp. BK591]|uniref:hypothetical protein n=1 Tax=Rhizobium sp. BK591 TaxID=2586985 RepID=UPI001044219F|nr:hypothetical protein [Rhizobium sp. BK591]MBB3746989.1 hypothetical protein [Rhizobium sp. BK591]